MPHQHYSLLEAIQASPLLFVGVVDFHVFWLAACHVVFLERNKCYRLQLDRKRVLGNPVLRSQEVLPKPLCLVVYLLSELFTYSGKSEFYYSIHR